MNAEALVGKVLGSYTLRRVIGQGSMGTVYLARQSQSQRQVVIKIFLTATTLEPLQYTDFMERFRHEMEAVALLEHPHILSIDEFEERDGFVYIVMPYVSMRTLKSALRTQETLPLPKIADYCDQLAGALDYAHEHGVLHLDIKPSNILVASINDELLFTDFALTKTMTERQAARMRQFQAGMLDYMAPELVMGKEAGEKADQYALGAVLYHLVTGSAPFHGTSLVEVAKKTLQESPPSPCSKRTDLPPAAAQVILRALAKSPSDRYDHARDLASAFYLALAVPSNELQQTELTQPQREFPVSSDIFPTSPYPPYSLFDSAMQTDFIPADNSRLTSSQSTPIMPAVGLANVRKPLVPLAQENESKHTLPVLSAVHPDPAIPVEATPLFSEQATDLNVTLTAPDIDQDAPKVTEQTVYKSDMFAITGTERRTTGDIIKLTSPVKIVNMPVAGKPGRYLIGLMPSPPTPPPEVKALAGGTSATNGLQKHFKIIGVVMLVLLVLGTGTFWFEHQRSHSTSPAAVTIVKTPDVRATMTAQAEATAAANIILTDPLAQNIHNWPTSSSGSIIYSFEDGAYHITDNDNARAAPAILPDVILKDPFVYSLTMEEIKGDDTSVNNEFGLILRATTRNVSGKTITTFYTFEVLNIFGGEYQFWKYDDSQGSNVNPWKKLGNHPLGNEFHEGHGPKSINTFKVISNGKSFALLVNGKQVWTVQDSSLASGGIGMLVNLKGTEVAFSNLLLTYR